MALELSLFFENGELKCEMSKSVPIRPYKGKSLLSLPNDYTIIDIETTGLSPDFDEIIEISALKCRNDIVIDEYSSLVCPDDIDMVDDFITNLTGITQEMLQGQPHISEILPYMLKFIGEDIVIAHNANFDINFIYDKAEDALDYNFSNNFIDTLRISRRALPDLKNHKLITVAENFGIITDGSHRSLNDCKITHGCYLKLKEFISDSPHISNAILIDTSNLNLRKITAESADIDTDNPFYEKECVFTGKLEKMPRHKAAQLVVNLGATAGNSVTARTNFLILGNNDYCSTIKDGKSAKQKKAEKLILSGADLQIIPENIFYEMIAEYQKI